MAQKELESVRELRGLKLKWSQWQRSTIRLEFSKRWLLLNEKEAISASSNVVDGVIEFSSQLGTLILFLKLFFLSDDQ